MAYDVWFCHRAHDSLAWEISPNREGTFKSYCSERQLNVTVKLKSSLRSLIPKSALTWIADPHLAP